VLGVENDHRAFGWDAETPLIKLEKNVVLGNVKGIREGNIAEV